MRIRFLFLISLALFFISSCKKEQPAQSAIELEYGSATDVDTNSYQTVRIGGLMWFGENLKSTRFRNGDALFHVKNEHEWDSIRYESTPAWAYANFDSTSVTTHGLMYNYWAVTDSRGIAPEGWHISNKEEWEKLIGDFGTVSTAGRALKSISGWEKNGNNISGFNAKPGGFLTYTGAIFSYEESGMWWVNTPIGIYGGRHTVLLPGQNQLVNIVTGWDDGAMFIRCVEDY